MATSSGAVVSTARLAKVPEKWLRGLASTSQPCASCAASGAAAAHQPSASTSMTA